MMTTSPKGETSQWRSAFQPLTMVPRPIAPSRRLSPEQELMLAVLRQTLDDYGRALTESHARARRERYVLERWIFGDDLEWPFSYLNVCDGVGIDSDALRAELRRWRARRATLVRLASDASRPFRLPNRAMRGSRTRVGATA
jgi:hypothetical protein